MSKKYRIFGRPHLKAEADTAEEAYRYVLEFEQTCSANDVWVWVDTTPISIEQLQELRKAEIRSRSE